MIWLSLALILGPLAGRAHASASQTSIIQDDGQLLNNPTAALLRVRQLGADQIRVALRWQYMAPDPTSHTVPKNFQASNPAAYPHGVWARYDSLDLAATADSIPIDLDVVGGAPLWATAPGGGSLNAWEPSATAFGAFVRAAGTRYSGNYDPNTNTLEPGNPADLPRISFWSVWNEPNYAPSLRPQSLTGHPGVEYSPRMYRQLVNAEWNALHATGHGSDTLLIGELAPRSNRNHPFTFSQSSSMLPVVFVQSLYCVDGNYRPLRGQIATLEGCPATAAGSARFEAGNPALFKAAGFSDHPYMRWYPPNKEENNPKLSDFGAAVRDYSTLATIGNLETALKRARSAYHVHRTFPIWNTEFGYITSPPKRRTKQDPYPWVSQTNAAYYDNWAEYLSWKNPQIMSFDQYGLQDAEPALPTNDYGGFASALLNYNGSQKPGYRAFRLPVFMPEQTTSSPDQALEVWGAAKPAHFVQIDDPGVAQSVMILFAPLSTGQYTILETVPITSAEGYFDTYVDFPSSGTLALEYIYPQDSLLAAPGVAVFSRHVQVTVN